VPLHPDKVHGRKDAPVSVEHEPRVLGGCVGLPDMWEAILSLATGRKDFYYQGHNLEEGLNIHGQ
jgi:hypothetical protein